jgi:diaminobutyrate-2-oxoglutarate transaminase
MDFSELSFAEAPLIKTAPPGPASLEYLEFQSDNEGAAVSYPKGLPMALKKGRGATVEDVDGNIYIDFFGGAGVMNVGHANPHVLDEVRVQLPLLTHSLDVPSEPRRRLVSALLDVLPPDLDRVFFGGPTGADAVEAAVKLAKLNTGRKTMMSFEGAYHGMTAGALSLTSGLAFKEDLFPLVPGVQFVPYAYCYRCAFGRKPETCGLECAAFVEHRVENPHSGDGRPAALIVEAIQGEGGSIVPPDTFLPRLGEICRKYDILLIVDEIQAGLCRTGRMFAFEHSSVVPDITTLSKGLGGLGFPISAIAYRKSLDTWKSGKHIGTFRGNVIAYTAGAAALRFMREQSLAEHAARLGGRMLDWLKELAGDFEIIGDVRGRGLMLGIELVRNRATKEPAPDLAKAVRSACFQRGLLVEIGGHFNNVVRFLPPLVVTEILARKGAEIFADALKEVERNR